MNQSQELHVIFGTGPVGTTVAQQLSAQGVRVRAVNRSGKGALPSGVELVRGDAMDLEAVHELSKGATVIYNCTHVPYPDWPQFLPTLQRNIIEGAASANAKLVVIDTLYMYGETHGQIMTENTPHKAATRKGRLRAEIVKNYLQAHQSGKVRVAIGRAADFFGPLVRDSSFGDRVFPQALTGKRVTVLGNPNLVHSYTYMPDIARSLVILGQRDEALGREWHLPTIANKTPLEMVNLLSKELGQPVKITTVPKLLVRGLGLFDPFMREYVELFYQHTEPQIVDSSAIAKTFGLYPTSIDEALHETIKWYRTQQ